MNERSIFIAALDKENRSERAAYLDQACAGDAALRQRIERLLLAHECDDSFLAEPAPAPDATTADVVLTEGPGTRVGPYKLLQQIGEGGMGIVYMAEQQEPVRRKVALKIIKPGMDSAQVIARFEAERQALALMDHQNIARVLDAGAIPGEPGCVSAGRPYFVMELVHGVPITRYCDDNRLTPQERLELFIPVCQAIQHAHQKGIIHRDIKPSNVMMCLYDGQPVPKVIDFGVAKAIEQRLTERTLFAQYGTIVGTWEYMAPEQAELSQLGVDTRSDLYALGVRTDASSVTVSNCAIFGNLAQGGTAGSSAVGGDGLGGGLYASSGTVMLDAVLVSGNQSQGGADIQGNTTGNGLGGGVYVDPSATATASAQTMMVGNHASKDNNDVFGTINIVP
jgi:serine/threonine protein kinase